MPLRYADGRPFFVQVDPTAPDLAAFPAFAEIAAFEAVLAPGDVIFFPVRIVKLLLAGFRLRKASALTRVEYAQKRSCIVGLCYSHAASQRATLCISSVTFLSKFHPGCPTFPGLRLIGTLSTWRNVVHQATSA